jgi:Holliday junction resolvase RusA-like endonuclease
LTLKPKEKDMIFTIELPVPTNRAYATNRGRWYKTDECKAWEEKAGWTIKQSWKEKPLEGHVIVSIWFMFENDRRDIDGGIKSVLDLLQRQGVYKNDRLVWNMDVHKRIDKEFPRCVVEVNKL